MNSEKAPPNSNTRHKNDSNIKLSQKNNFFLKYNRRRIQNSQLNNELLLLFKKRTDTLIEQTKTKPHESLEFTLNKQMDTFSFNLPMNLYEEGKWLLAVTSFEPTNSVFNIIDENNNFSISTLSF